MGSGEKRINSSRCGFQTQQCHHEVCAFAASAILRCSAAIMCCNRTPHMVSHSCTVDYFIIKKLQRSKCLMLKCIRVHSTGGFVHSINRTIIRIQNHARDIMA